MPKKPETRTPQEMLDELRWVAAGNYREGTFKFYQDSAKVFLKLAQAPAPTDNPIPALVEQLHEEMAEHAEKVQHEATPLERAVAESFCTEEARARGQVEIIWPVHLPDARKAIAAVNDHYRPALAKLQEQLTEMVRLSTE